jgi:hypothetical protein
MRMIPRIDDAFEFSIYGQVATSLKPFSRNSLKQASAAISS